MGVQHACKPDLSYCIDARPELYYVDRVYLGTVV